MPYHVVHHSRRLLIPDVVSVKEKYLIHPKTFPYITAKAFLCLRLYGVIRAQFQESIGSHLSFSRALFFPVDKIHPLWQDSGQTRWQEPGGYYDTPESVACILLENGEDGERIIFEECSA